MIDYLKVVAKIDFLFDPTKIGIVRRYGLIFKPIFHKWDQVFVEKYEGWYKGLRVLMFNDRIEIYNSLHKFYKGNNYTDFSYSELINAINELCEIFNIEARYWIIKKIEVGFNLLMPKNANEYLEYFLLYKNKEFSEMRHKINKYGIKCYMSEYSLKIYDKAFQTFNKDRTEIDNKLLRVELLYNQPRKLPKEVKTLEDLKNKENVKKIFNQLLGMIQNITIGKETDFNGSTFEERALYYASLNPDFLKVEKKLKNEQLKEVIKRIKQLKERFLKKGFKEILIKTLNDKYIDLYCS